MSVTAEKNILRDVIPFKPEYDIPGLELDFVALSEVARARIVNFIQESRAAQSEGLSASGQVLIKHEADQPGNCFKLRGAQNATIANLEDGNIRTWAPSAGSHSTGMILSAQQHGGDFIGVVPLGTPDSKKAFAQRAGMKLLERGSTFDEAYELGKEHFKNDDRQLVHPFADPNVIAGQGTMAWELAGQVPDMTHVVLPAGGGGLAAGVASSLKCLLPDVQVIVAQVEGCSAFVDSLQSGELRQAKDVNPRYGGIAVAKPHPLTVAIASHKVDKTITIPTVEVYRAIQTLKRETGTLYEYAGGVAPAAAHILSRRRDFVGSKIVAIATGANPGAHFEALVDSMVRRHAY